MAKIFNQYVYCIKQQQTSLIPIDGVNHKMGTTPSGSRGLTVRESAPSSAAAEPFSESPVPSSSSIQRGTSWPSFGASPSTGENRAALASTALGRGGEGTVGDCADIAGSGRLWTSLACHVGCFVRDVGFHFLCFID